MRFAASLTLFLTAPVGAVSRDRAARMRLLQRAENAASAPTNNRRALYGKDKVGGPGGGGKGGYGGTGMMGDMVDPEDAPHTAAMDANDGGISVEFVEYEYGTPVEVSFQLKNEYIPDDIIMGLDPDTVGSWTVGVFMRMADPQGGSLEPILSVRPKGLGGSRRLQDTGEGGPPPAPGPEDEGAKSSLLEPAGPEDEADVDELADSGPPPVFDMSGSAIIKATSAGDLDPDAYGTGFDAYLLDQDGAAVLGPATFYMKETEAMAAETEAKMAEKPTNPLVKFSHAKKKKGNGLGRGAAKGKAGPSMPAEDLGMGTGMDGDMVIGTVEALAAYVLETDAKTYDLDATVTVTFDLNPGGKRRFLQKGRKGGEGKVGIDVFDIGGDLLGKDSDETTTAASAAADTITEATVDMDAGGAGGAGDDADGYMGGGVEEQEDPAEVAADISRYSLGVYMRMANPQGGDLPPIFSIPFGESLEHGKFTFPAADAGAPSGYDVWILDGLGNGVAGPTTFYILPDADDV